jgi:coenzyme F420-0:L-glutamate ligase/coenzyme F420-1:gamma-L-glutamate ligase
MAAAGIDASNVDPARLVLLPKDPDASARALRASLRDRFSLDVAVIVSDTMGRPWRVGLTDVALGAAGVPPIVDYRGELDPYGNEMHLTQMAVIDELSGAAELVKGKFDQVPVGVVRGYFTRPSVDDGPGARTLVRESEQDLFSLGTAEARAAGLAQAAGLTDAAAFGDGGPGGGGAGVPPVVIVRILDSLTVAPTTAMTVTSAPADAPAGTAAAVSCTTADPGDLRQLVSLGTDVHRLRCSLAAVGLATMVAPAPDSTMLILVGPV